MLFSQRVLQGVVEGEVTVAFRRWSSPQAEAGTHVRTSVGVVGIGEVAQVDPAEITEGDAHQAGFGSLPGLRASLDKHGNGPVYRVELWFVGPDAGGEPRERVVLAARERAEIDRSLARWDVSAPRGPWTRSLLELLRDRPGARAAEVAGVQQRPVSRVKSDLWKLTELGVTEKAPRPAEDQRESTTPVAGGYRLSPRGQAYLDG